jgi:hypothetical protein
LTANRSAVYGGWPRREFHLEHPLCSKNYFRDCKSQSGGRIRETYIQSGPDDTSLRTNLSEESIGLCGELIVPAAEQFVLDMLAKALMPFPAT